APQGSEDCGGARRRFRRFRRRPRALRVDRKREPLAPGGAGHQGDVPQGRREVNVVAVTNEQGEITNADLLAAAESVHRQLRPHLPDDYVGRMKEVFAGGAEMAVAIKDGHVTGLTVFRVLEKTHSGRDLYCDDLVTDEKLR